MNRQEFAAWENRITARADRLWHEAGRPEGPRDRFVEEARELVAIEENKTAGTVDPDAGPVVEEAGIQGNLGEFASFGDQQGEQPSFPDPQNEKPSAE